MLMWPLGEHEFDTPDLKAAGATSLFPEHLWQMFNISFIVKDFLLPESHPFTDCMMNCTLVLFSCTMVAVLWHEMPQTLRAPAVILLWKALQDRRL